MANKSVKKNYVYNLAYQILLIITPLITTPYISRVLGADGVGIYSYTNSIVSYFILFAGLGSTVFGQREVSYNQENKLKRSIVFWNVAIFRLITSTIILIAYVIFALNQTEYRTIYLILIINIINVFFDITWFFQGLEEFGKIVGRNFVIRLLTIVFIFVFIRNKTDLSLYIFGLAGLTAAGSLSMWPYLRKYIFKPRKKDIHLTKDIGTILTFFIPTIAIQIYTVLDKTMIGLITKSEFQNGYYEQAQKISAMALTFITSLGTVMIPKIGYYFAQGKKDEIKVYMYKSYRFVWMLSIPLCFGIIGIASNMVPWFFGSGYDEVIPLMRILSLLVIVIGIHNVTGMQYLIPTKRQNKYTLCIIIGTAANFVLNYFLIRIYASIGAAIASVVAEGIVAIVELFIVRKEIKVFSVLKSSAKYLISGVCMFAIIFAESFLLKSSIINSIIMIISGAFSYALFLIILRDEFFLDNVRNVVSIIIKRH